MKKPVRIPLHTYPLYATPLKKIRRAEKVLKILRFFLFLFGTFLMIKGISEFYNDLPLIGAYDTALGAWLVREADE